MLKTISSITNAIGALNYKGTWNASTNTPTLASGVGTKGDYYVVSVAGSTTLDGISNWGVGDLATYNGSVWQRVEGGADLNGVNLSVSGTTTLSGLTASTALALDASKNVVSVTNTGTGDNVLATSPTLTTPILGVASATSLNKVALTAPATNATLTIAEGKTLTVSNSLTVAGTDATTMTFPTTSASIARTDAAQSFTGNQTLATGNLVIGTSGQGIADSTGGTTALFTSTEVTVNKPVISTRFTSVSGSTASTASGTPVTIFAVPVTVGNYLVSASVGATDDPTNYNPVSILRVNRNASVLTSLAGTATMTITLSGSNVQSTQNIGSSQVIQFAITRIF